MDGCETTLPDGWIVKRSKSHPDRVYYFNINTGESSWEYPDLLQAYVNNASATGAPALSSTSLNTTEAYSTQEPGCSDSKRLSGGTTSATDNPGPCSTTTPISRTAGTSKTNLPRTPTVTAVAAQVESTLKDIQKCLKGCKASVTPQCSTKNKTVSDPRLVKSESKSGNARCNTDSAISTQTLGASEELTGKKQITKASGKVKICDNNAGMLSECNDSIMPVSASSRKRSGSATRDQLRKDLLDLYKKEQKETVLRKPLKGVSTRSNQGSNGVKTTQFMQEKQGDSRSDKKQTNVAVASAAKRVCSKPLSRESLGIVLKKDQSKADNGKSDETKKKTLTSKGKGDQVEADRKTRQVANNSSSHSKMKRKYVDLAEPSTKRSRAEDTVYDQYVQSKTSKRQRGKRKAKSDAAYKTTSNIRIPETDARKSCSNTGQCRTSSSKQGTLTQECIDLTGENNKTAKVDNENTGLECIDLTCNNKNEKNGNFNTNSKSSKTKNSQTGARIDLTVSRATGGNLTPDSSCQVIDASDVLGKSKSQDFKRFNTGGDNDGSVGATGADDGDRNNNTEYKLFIGNKEKLVSIQSWINDATDGAWSDGSDHQFPIGKVKLRGGTNVTSSLARPAQAKALLGETVTKTGTKSGAVAQHPVAMETEVSVVNQTRSDVADANGCYGDKEEEMDIDDVLLEVRQLVRRQSDSSSTAGNRDTSFSSPLPKLPGDTNILTIVVDTNVLMNNIDMLDDLKDWEIKDGCRPCLYIPWIVMLELDKLKETRKHGNANVVLKAQFQARKAITFLNQLFEMKHPRLVGQTPREYEAAKTDFKAECNDDVILQACLQCQKNNKTVILFSNDNMLVTKCLVSGIPAFNCKKILPGIEEIVRDMNMIPTSPANQKAANPGITNNFNQSSSSPTTVNQSGKGRRQNGSMDKSVNRLNTCTPRRLYNVAKCDNKGPNVAGTTPRTRPPSVTLTPGSVTSNKVNNSYTQKQTSYTMKALVDDVYCKLKMLLHEFLGRVLEVEMQLAFGDELWERMLYRKPPWSLKDILECWRKHWIAVFGMVLPRFLQRNVQTLHDNFSFTQGHTIDTMSKASADALEILVHYNKRNNCDGMVPRIMRCVSCLGTLCTDVSRKTVTLESISSLNEYLKSKLGSVPVISLHRSSSVSSSEEAPTASQPQTNNASASRKSSLSNDSNKSRHAIWSLSSQNNNNNTGNQLTPGGGAGTQPCSTNRNYSMQNKAQTSSDNLKNMLTESSSVPLTIETNQPQPGTSTSHIPTSTDCAQSCDNVQQNVCNNNQSSHVTGSEVISQEPGSDIINNAACAGQRLEQIWNFINRCCDEVEQLAKASPGGLPRNVEEKMAILITISMQLHNAYSRLLQLPVSDLGNHEADFGMLCNVCNRFFSTLNCQISEPLDQLSTIQFLYLYSLPQHRNMLEHFKSELEKMLLKLHGYAQANIPAGS